MTEPEFRRRIQAAVKAITAEYLRVLTEDPERLSMPAVDRLLWMWRLERRR